MAADKDFALIYLADSLYDAVLRQAGAVRPAHLLRSLPGDLRVSVGLIRKLLTDDERFVEVDGRYDIAEREALCNRPFGGVIEAILQGYGRPMPVSLLAHTLARVRGGSPTGARELLDEYAEGRDNLLFLGDLVVPDDWLLRMGGESDEELFFYNGLTDDEELRGLWEACGRRDLRKRDPIATAVNILKAFKQPIGLREIAFLSAVHHPQIFDPVDFVTDLIAGGDVAFIHGPHAVDERLLGAARRHLKKLSEKAKGKDEVMPAADLAALLAEEPPDDADDFLEEEDRDNILAVVGNARAPIGINELLIDILEMRPNARKYKIAAHAVRKLLDADDGLMRTSVGCYLAGDAVPGWVSSVPDDLVPETLDLERDVLLRVEGLHETLRPAVVDPAREDILAELPIEPGDEHVAADRIEFPLLYHHYLAGTMFVRTMDRDFLGGDSSISVLNFRSADEDVFSVWLNRELNLVFGLTPWYRDHAQAVGALITVTPGDRPGEFLIEHGGEMDEAIAIDDERLAVLEDRRERLATRPISVFELLVDILDDYRSGMRFDALWAEVNVVRRVTRLQIASSLSWFKCFDYVGGKTQGWEFVPDLINEGGDEELAEFVIAAEPDADDED